MLVMIMSRDYLYFSGMLTHEIQGFIELLAYYYIFLRILLCTLKLFSSIR